MTAISVMNTLFWICLSFAILFFIVSVVLFFLFDIRTIFNIKTGRAQAKTVKEMQAANENTGRLRVGGKTQTSKLSEDQKKEPRAPAVKPPSAETKNLYYSGEPEGTEVLQPQGNENTTVLQPEGNENTTVLRPEGNENTTVLRPEGNENTTVLSQSPVSQQTTNYAETTVLSGKTFGAPVVQPVSEDSRVGFKVTKKVVLIHTNEMI